MEALIEYFKVKKNLIKVLIVALLIIGIPVGIYLIQTQKIFKSGASVKRIEFTGPNVEQRGDKLVATKQEIALKLTTIIDQEQSPSSPPVPSTPPQPSAPVEPGRATASINASPATTTAGHAVTISWSSTNAAKCYLDYPGVGAKEVSTSGSDVYHPDTTTTYGVRCEAPGVISSGRQTVAVTVNPPLPCTDKEGASCTFDTRTMYYDSDGSRIESITAYGRYWNFRSPISGGWLPMDKNGSDLTSESRYANGPCSGKTAGSCTFDTRNIFVQNDGKKIETITAYGKYWNFDSSTGWGAMSGNGSDLTSIDRYASGPCSGRSAGSCKFDTRTMYYETDGSRIESITAYGKYWNFKSPISGGWFVMDGSGSDLTSVARYASGPCSGQSTCTFDSRTMLVKDGKKTESITAYGKYYNFDSSTGWGAMSGNGSNLSEESRYK